jgi:hypothetical protein
MLVDPDSFSAHYQFNSTRSQLARSHQRFADHFQSFRILPHSPTAHHICKLNRLVKMSDFVKDSNPTMAERGTGFLDLPYELRLQIYRLSLPTGMVFNLADRPTFLGLPTNGYGIASTEHEPYLLPGKVDDDGGDHEDLRGDEADDLSHDKSGEDSPEISDDDLENDNHEEDASDSEDDDSEDGGFVADMWYFEDEHKYRPFSPPDKWPNEAPMRRRRVKHIQAYLLVSRQVYEEVLDVLYGENLFFVWLPTHEHDLTRLTAARRRRIRHLMLVLQASSFIIKGGQLDINFRLNKDIWDDNILSNLKTLHVVATQPFRATGPHDWNCVSNIGNQMEQWPYVLAPILMYLRRKLPTYVGVFVDVNGWHTSPEVFDKMLLVPQGFQHCQTKMGDFLLERYATDDTEHFGPFREPCDWCETYLRGPELYSLPRRAWWRLKE